MHSSTKVHLLTSAHTHAHAHTHMRSHERAHKRVRSRDLPLACRPAKTGNGVKCLRILLLRS
eukprot:6185027-Pleurochrysis_carterae.AAC.1